MLATVTAADRGTMATLISTNAGLYSSVAKKIAVLSAVNDVMVKLPAAALNNGGGGAATAVKRISNSGADKRSSNNGGNGHNRPVTNNYNYCWSYGYHIHEYHTSITCTRRAYGHTEQATKSNTMGGRQ
jgi:hypothetical protein